MKLENIKRVDSAVAELIEQELERQRTTIELIASENFTSEAVMEACGSVLTNKYAEGKPYKRFYNGCDNIDKIEELAQKNHQNDRKKKQEFCFLLLYYIVCFYASLEM